METIEFVGIICITLISLVIFLPKMRKKVLEPKELTRQDKIDLITGKRKTKTHYNGRSIWVDEEEGKYSFIGSRYKVSYAFARVKPNEEFQMSGEVCAATPNVVEGSRQAVLAIRKMCREEYGIDIHWELYGISSEEAPV